MNLKRFCLFPSKTLNKQFKLNRAVKWCSTNQLLIDQRKTKFLLIGTRKLMQTIPSHISLTLLETAITPVSSGKDLYLGVYLDSHITNDFQITELVSSCMSKLVQINRVKDSFDSDTLSLVIEALVINKKDIVSLWIWKNFRQYRTFPVE